VIENQKSPLDKGEVLIQEDLLIRETNLLKGGPIIATGKLPLNMFSLTVKSRVAKTE